VAVTARDDGSGQRLVAYVVGAPDAGADVLRAHANEFLPEYMVPSAFVALDALPRTDSGKIDRLALPAPEATVAAADTYVPPLGPAEEEIARIWAEVLGIERVGVRDDFFELGGHSLLATQVIARTRNALGVQVPLNVFFIDPTVAGLAAAVDEQQSEAPGDDLARLLDDLETLTDEEAERLLAAERDGQSEPAP
jgi:acyl carrier protein